MTSPLATLELLKNELLNEKLFLKMMDTEDLLKHLVGMVELLLQDKKENKVALGVLSDIWCFLGGDKSFFMGPALPTLLRLLCGLQDGTALCKVILKTTPKCDKKVQESFAGTIDELLTVFPRFDESTKVSVLDLLIYVYGSPRSNISFGGSDSIKIFIQSIVQGHRPSSSVSDAGMLLLQTLLKKKKKKELMHVAGDIIPFIVELCVWYSTCSNLYKLTCGLFCLDELDDGSSLTKSQLNMMQTAILTCDDSYNIRLLFQITCKSLNKGKTLDMNEFRTVNTKSWLKIDSYNAVRHSRIESHLLPTNFGELVHPSCSMSSLVDSKRSMLLEYVTSLKESQQVKPPTIYTEERLYTFQNEIQNVIQQKNISAPGRLQFESNFESGNLASAYYTADDRYDLTLSADTNSHGQVQWFYFAVYGLEPSKDYIFNILNLEKVDSLYNSGLQPLLFCPRSASKHSLGWVRNRFSVCYLKNGFEKVIKLGKARKVSSCYSALMTISLPSEFEGSPDSPIFIAYCYPYGYGSLMNDLKLLSKRPFLKVSTLCCTIAGNICPLVTIMRDVKKTCVYVSARVHPGESNSSFVMRGLLDYLTSAKAHQLLDHVMFRIVPMLNPDGVIVGNHRCNLAGVDLNRQWLECSDTDAPTISSFKELMKQVPPVLFVDIHGHSVNSGAFLYGCSKPKPSPNEFASEVSDALSKDYFNEEKCIFKVQQSKQNTGRVVVWKDLKVADSYTMEVSLGGDGKRHFNIEDFELVGQKLGSAIHSFLKNHNYQPKNRTLKKKKETKVSK